MSFEFIRSPTLFVAAFLGLLVIGIVLRTWHRNRTVEIRSESDSLMLRLGFQPAEFDSQIREMLEALTLGSNGPPAEGTLHHCLRDEAHYFPLSSNMMTVTNLSGHQFSMLVTSTKLGLPHMAMMPQLQLDGLLGRFVDDALEHIPIGSLQPVELDETESFRLFAQNPMQARAFFVSWRLAQLSKLCEAFVSCNGNAFMCSLLETDPHKVKNITASVALNRLIDISQRLYAGFTQ